MAIGAHPDDVEIGMGGTIISMVKQNIDVTILDLTDGEPTPRGTVEKRKNESEKAKQILGVKNRINITLKNRYLTDDIPSRQKLAEQFRINRPEIIFAPYWIDAHPDHIAASKLCDAARFYGKLTKTNMEGDPYYVPKIYYYLVSHIRLNISPNFIYNISDEMEKKLTALECYESQFGSSLNQHAGIAWVKRKNSYWGGLIGREYGEAFISKECVGIKNIQDLV
ncbi:MAG: bacillithiol biosynthesis deacetylase BshB1 [Atribacterota bacterium]|nr:bacillithiol biosynthesis deacetylase BshB1 [Atribacterota bacterium]